MPRLSCCMLNVLKETDVVMCSKVKVSDAQKSPLKLLNVAD